MIKNKRTLAIAASMLLVSMNSHALITIVNPGAIVTATVGQIALRGLAFTAVGGGIVLIPKGFEIPEVLHIPVFLLGALTVAFGLSTLDGESGKVIQFAPISAQDAVKLGVNADDAEVYNLSVDLINATYQEIVVKAAQSEDQDAQLKASTEGWVEAASIIPAQALKVAKVIVTQ